MSHKDFRSTGLRVLRGDNGDILIADSGWKTGVKMFHTIRWDAFDKAMNDDREAAIIVRQLHQFLRKHHALSEAELQKAKEAKEAVEEKERQRLSE